MTSDNLDIEIIVPRSISTIEKIAEDVLINCRYVVPIAILPASFPDLSTPHIYI